MRVKRLEIQGFKSFKDKTVIHFDHSITGIVGPNGCGKSNIVDAFFWVMGEQSYKHMRGSGSEDLIFNGSSKYSPLGVAEATLVLETPTIDPANGPSGATAADDPSYISTKEISVTRRLYRSGEGEYFINGTLARLKDIQELFMDTGVGAKGYSVIEQGQIGKIVNSKPEERRLLIEEAAGIAKYKARKKESLRKIEATYSNMARLADIIQEIEKSLASLERQAQKAAQYKKYRGQLQEKEMTWGKRRRQAFLIRLTELRSAKDLLEIEQSGLRAELQASENLIQTDQNYLLTRTKEAEDAQEQIQELSDELSRDKSALELSRRRQGDLNSQLENLESEKLNLTETLANDERRLIDVGQESGEAQAELSRVAQTLESSSASLKLYRDAMDQARSEKDRSQRELLGSLQRVSELQAKMTNLLGRAEVAHEQVNRLQQQISSQEQKHQEVEEELTRVKILSEELTSKRTELQTEKKQQAERVQTFEQTVRQEERERNDAQRALTQLKSRLTSLEELDESHEGLAEGSKAALDWAKETGHSAQIKSLVDDLKVTSGFETILQSWLEHQLDHLVLKEPALAFDLLDAVLRSNRGRVGVQVLAPSRAPSDSPKISFTQVRGILDARGLSVLGELSSFVSATDQALEHLLQGVVVIDSPGANSPGLTQVLTEDYAQIAPWSIISKDHVVIDGHSDSHTVILRGGSLGQSGAMSLMKRRQTMEEIRNQIDAAEKAFSLLEKKWNESKLEREIAQAKLQTLQMELQDLEIELAGANRDIHQTERAFKESERQLESFTDSLANMVDQEQRALRDRDQINLQLEECTTSQLGHEQKMKELETSLSEKEFQFRTHESETQSTKIQEVSLKERLTSIKREMNSLQSVMQDRKKRSVEIERILERAQEEHAGFSGNDGNLMTTIEDLTRKLGSLRENLAETRDEIEQLNARVGTTLEKMKSLHKKTESTSTDANQLALEIEKLSGDLTHLQLNLEEKYGLGCLEQIQTPFAPEEGETQATVEPQQEPASVEMTPEEELILGEEVERLRERIRRLGEVNLMAIEEYDTLKVRYDHLLTEKKDLEHSLDNLNQAIEHINKTSEERFKKAFEAIASRFERLFPVIFGGGQAKLSLVYPENSADILEAGVDILAQPPGKKVSNITLLSGGEKALTAVSLIFAIFMVKPSPFCVLDEVDAPLDDANIGKFNALLKEMSVKSQFILITHNKKTMELNNTLYGVTMEEPGVSKMVSIELG